MNRFVVFFLTMIFLGQFGVSAAEKEFAIATSPDKLNVIKLSFDPLSYEVFRAGKQVVAKSAISLKIDGERLAVGKYTLSNGAYSGAEPTRLSKKAAINLEANWTKVDFGEWGVRLVARNDGVAYRFESKKAGQIKVDEEQVTLAIPDPKAQCWLNRTPLVGCEETVSETMSAGEIITDGSTKKLIYLPVAYTHDSVTVLMTESDVRDYPILNFVRPKKSQSVVLDSWMCGYPLEYKSGDFGTNAVKGRGRYQRVAKTADYLVITKGERTFPWRTFILADDPAKILESDIVSALAPAPDPDVDYSWVKPGKVAWDWWNYFDNGAGCNTKTYRRFIDFAASNGVEYVIFDEGWSAHLDIWNDSKDVDVPGLIKYAEEKGVGIILWMAWAQLVGEESRVAEHFAKLGAKGFKVDFMDRGDAAVVSALELFVKECAKRKMIVDYHGVYRPVGLHRKYPNLINYEGVHGLEQMKWHNNGYDFMLNDIRVSFLRMAIGPMDYTPGAMRNFARGTYVSAKNIKTPGSYGTRSRQMAMMALFEAPLQMLCDSPTNYEKNMHSFRFMAATPVVWDDVVALGGTPDTFVALARKAKDGSWYASGINNWDRRDVEFKLDFLGAGEWKAEIFRDAKESDLKPEMYVNESKMVTRDSQMKLSMAGGGGFVIRFSK